MDDAVTVGEGDGTGEHLQHLGRGAWGLGTAVQPFLERFPLDVFHREVHPPADFADLVDLHDIGMSQRGRGLRLGAKPVPIGQARVLAGEDHLQGRRPTEVVMPCLVHDPHGAPAQLADDFITGDGPCRLAQVRGCPGR